MPNSDAKLIPERSLWVSPKDSYMHFIRWPWEYLAYLTIFCGLHRKGSVLELGCHHGRTAIGLNYYLLPGARYEGLDILSKQIRWAKSTFDPSIFHFHHADVYNGMYNPTGKISPDSYILPFKNEEFNTVFAASLFTHLTPTASHNYFKEIGRVLKKGGMCLLSFCLLDKVGLERLKDTSCLYSFPYLYKQSSGVRVKDKNLPELLIGYYISSINKLLKGTGLNIDQVLPGYWSNKSENTLNEQDLVIFRK